MSFMEEIVRIKSVIIAFVIMIFWAGALSAQTDSVGSSISLKGMSFNGATGLYSIPSGRVGWEHSANIGLDFGYSLIAGDGQVTHIPKVAVSFLKFIELSTAFDVRPKPDCDQNSDNNLLFGAKFQFPTNNKVAVAIGGNFQVLGLGAKNHDNHQNHERRNASQIYVATTYAGNFFEWPSETTVVIGYTFREHDAVLYPSSNVDFGMGFDLVLLPKVFQNIIHFIVDFSNFTYVANPPPPLNAWRGYLNTGIRIDFAKIIRQEKFKFSADILMTDAFDANRGFSTGAVFGIGF